MTRVLIVAVSTVLALAAAIPASAQKGPKAHNSAPPSRSVLTGSAGVAPASEGAVPFAWIDDASVLPPGVLALSMSMQVWNGADLTEVDAPVVGAAVGLTRRLQLGASVPRVVGGSDPGGVVGGLGTTFVSGKIAVLTGARTGVKLAVAPTVQILAAGALASLGPGESRAQFGVPVSAEVDRGIARIFGSAGYFTNGVRFGGGGIGARVTSHVAASAGFSRAWTTDATDTPARDRRELSGSLAFSVNPRLSLFGSVGRTVATTDQNGAGTTFSAGAIILIAPATIK